MGSLKKKQKNNSGIKLKTYVSLLCSKKKKQAEIRLNMLRSIKNSIHQIYINIYTHKTKARNAFTKIMYIVYNVYCSLL